MRSLTKAFPIALLFAAACGATIDPSAADDQTRGDELTGTGGTLPGDPDWAMASNGSVPADAIVAGFDLDGAPLYSCRAAWNGGVHPGKTRRDWTQCHLGWGGVDDASTTYQVLVPAWSWAQNGAIPVDAMPFGNEADGTPMYACRASWAGGVHLGKIEDGFGACYIPYGGQEIHAASYAVLGGNVPLRALPSSLASLDSAIVGGQDGDGAPLYPCIAAWNGGVHPGKTRRGWNACDVSWGGSEHWVSTYELIVPEMNPAPLAQTGNVPRPYVAGHEARVLLTPGAPLGVCSADVAIATQPGKYKMTGACNYADNGVESVATSAFQVLSGAEPRFAPHSIDYGVVTRARTATISLLPLFDDDITVGLGGAQSEGYSIAHVTSWKPVTGGGAPVVDQQLGGSGTLHVLAGRRVTIDVLQQPDWVNYSVATNAVVVSAATWSFRVPLSALPRFVDPTGVMLGHSGLSDQEAHHGGAGTFQVTATNIGTQPAAFSLSASVDAPGLTVDPTLHWQEGNSTMPMGGTATIQPGAIQTWSFSVKVAWNAPYVSGAPVTISLASQTGSASIIDSLTVTPTACAGRGAQQYDGAHEGCCVGTAPDNHGMCMPCGHAGEACCTTSSACPGQDLQCNNGKCEACGVIGLKCCTLNKWWCPGPTEGVNDPNTTCGSNNTCTQKSQPSSTTCSGKTATSSAKVFAIGVKEGGSHCAVGVFPFFANSSDEAQQCAKTAYPGADTLTTGQLGYYDYALTSPYGVCTNFSAPAFSQSDAQSCAHWYCLNCGETAGSCPN